MKKKSVIIVLFPSLFMTLITIVSFSNMLKSSSLQFKGLFIISLIILFPLIFLFQGIISASSNTNIFLALGVSTLSFIILMIFYLNSTASIYIFIYLSFGIIGYLTNKFMIKGKSSENK